MTDVRPARHDDVDAMVRIALAGGSPDADERYLDFVASTGRLLVAHRGPHVVGFAGSVAIGDAVMVSDLFVHEDHRGVGLGSRLARELLQGAPRRMTCSSTHPAAAGAYRAAGMEPQWNLLTMRGCAVGGGAPLAIAPWRHGRRELIEYFRSRGAVVSGDRVVLTARRTDDADVAVHTVLRLVSDDPIGEMTAIVAAYPEGDVIELSVPEPHPLAAWLQAHGFAVQEHDVFFASDGVHLVPQVCSVHRGLL